MVISFSDLWNKCEELHKEAGVSTPASLFDELSLKFAFYKAIELKTDLPKEEQQKIKSRILGEILLTITNISLVDNINVYQALDEALKFRSIEHYSQKYK